jgi:hypothetical protein
MENYRSGVENTPDYLKNETGVFVNLSDVYPKSPETQITTHLRMVYGHVDWENLIYTLDDGTIRLLRKHKEWICHGQEVVDRLRKGLCVAILNTDTMGPVTYKEMLCGHVKIELYDLDQAIDNAARWFLEDTMESVYTYSLFTPYFLVAFRLALMEGDMSDEERFAEDRLSEVWRKTFSSVMYFAGQKMQKEAIDMVKKDYSMPFNLNECEINDFLKNM